MLELSSSCKHESKWICNTFCVIELPNGKRRLKDGEACEHESKWICNTFCLIELPNGKRRLKDGEGICLRKSPNWSDAIKREETVRGIHDLSLSQAGQSDYQSHGDDQSDSISLIPQIEQDITINCLLRCLRSDYSSISFVLICLCNIIPTLPSKFGALLEGPSCLVSPEMPSSCEHESRWISNTFCMVELSNGKCPLEDGEGISLRRSPKSLDVIEREETVQGIHNLSLYCTDKSENQCCDGNQSGSSSLIHQIGRDTSINCLLRCSRSDYGSIASLNRSFQSLIRSGELYRLRRQMGIIEHWVYFSCKLLEWEAFDPIRLRWMHLPRMTSNECFMCSDKESLAVGTELLVFGKEIRSHVIYKYSILTNSWSLGTEMNQPRCLFGSASLREMAIVAGGCGPDGNILRSAELYNSDTGTWVTLPSMNKPRKMCSGVFMDGKFYVIGGIGVGNPNLLTCGEVYDLEARTWQEIPNMFPARNREAGATETPATAKAPPLLAVVKNDLYAAYYAEKEVRKYDKKGNLWATVGTLPERPDSMNGWGLAFRACGDRLIVIGGPRALGGGTIEVNAWMPEEGPPQWSLLGSKLSGSFVYNCAVMGC